MKAAASVRPLQIAPQPNALQQIRTATAELIANGQIDEAVEYALSALNAVLRKNTELELLVAKLQRERTGTRSERIAPEQLALLLEGMQQLGAAGAEHDGVEEEREDAQLEKEIKDLKGAARDKRAKRRREERSWRAQNVKRQVHEVDLPGAQRACATCGQPKRRIGEDVARTLVYVPAHFEEHEYHLAKYACGKCKNGVSRAPGPVRVLERSAADASLLAQVVVSKYVDHAPLHRQHRMYQRMGVDLAVSTLTDWVAGVADCLKPIYEVLKARMLTAYVVRTDATGLKVLDPDSPANIERGTMWSYVGDDRDVVYHYAPDGTGASGPWALLAGRKGYVQADAATVFDRLFNSRVANALEVGCWAHARRKFEALRDTDFRVAYPLQLIRRMYRLETLADLKELGPDQRAEQRRQRTRPVTEKLKRWLIQIAETEPPASQLAKAAAYALNHWEALTRFLEDGRLDLDNNVCERQLRDVALGRKNFLFAGSHEAAERAAVLYSIVRTCALHHVPPLPYLTDVLRRLATGSPRRGLEELLPDQWQRLRQNQDPVGQHIDRRSTATTAPHA